MLGGQFSVTQLDGALGKGFIAGLVHLMRQELERCEDRLKQENAFSIVSPLGGSKAHHWRLVFVTADS